MLSVHEYFYRIVDNMPVTLCYDVKDSTKKYCSTGFPIGCYVTSQGDQKDNCVTSVSFLLVSRRVFRTLSIICDGAFFAKIVNDFKLFTIFAPKIPL